MEYWEAKADDDLILYTDPCHPRKNKTRSTYPSFPTFQYSIIPSPHAAGFTAIPIWAGLTTRFSAKKMAVKMVGTRIPESD